MMDPKRIRIPGTAVAVRGNDIDTDRIIPARYLRCVTFDGLGGHAFEDDRIQLKEKGKVHSLDDPRFHGAEILLVNKNFGCGSSREHAPQSIMRWGKGIKAIVGESFAEIFFGNCQMNGVPCVCVSEADIQKLMAASEENPKATFTVDLEAKQVACGNIRAAIEISEGSRQALLKGTWDTTAELLESKEAILATAAKLPYMDGWKA